MHVCIQVTDAATQQKRKKILASRALFMSWKFVIGIGFLMVDSWLEFFFFRKFYLHAYHEFEALTLHSSEIYLRLIL